MRADQLPFDYGAADTDAELTERVEFAKADNGYPLYIKWKAVFQRAVLSKTSRNILDKNRGE